MGIAFLPSESVAKNLIFLLAASVEELETVLAVNVRGVFLCYKHAAIQMIAQGRGGRIIGASSVAGKQGEALC